MEPINPFRPSQAINPDVPLHLLDVHEAFKDVPYSEAQPQIAAAVFRSPSVPPDNVERALADRIAEAMTGHDEWYATGPKGLQSGDIVQASDFGADGYTITPSLDYFAAVPLCGEPVYRVTPKRPRPHLIGIRQARLAALHPDNVGKRIERQALFWVCDSARIEGLKEAPSQQRVLI